MSVWVLNQHRRRFRIYGRPAGMVFVVIGLGLIGLLYAADMVTMWILPLFISEQAAMSYMNELHLNLSWFFILVANVFAFTGFALFSRHLFSQADELVTRTSQLEAANTHLGNPTAVEGGKRALTERGEISGYLRTGCRRYYTNGARR